MISDEKKTRCAKKHKDLILDGKSGLEYIFCCYDRKGQLMVSAQVIFSLVLILNGVIFSLK